MSLGVRKKVITVTRWKFLSPRSFMVSLVLVVAVALALLGVMATSSGAAAGDTTRVSVSSSGAQANNGSHWPSISSDGRFVAFESDATNLVPNDTNSVYDIFVYDRQMGTTERVSVNNSGTQQNAATLDNPGAKPDDLGWGPPSISADGRFVAFTSSATNLVPNDTNGYKDIFVHDRQTGTTERVSVTSSGAQASGGFPGSVEPSGSFNPSVSADGRFVAFSSWATNLVPNDTNGGGDVFVHDRQTDTTERVSVDSSGVQSYGGSSMPSISSDGRFVAFLSGASNLVPNDTNATTDVFVRDRQVGTTERVSVSNSGAQANGKSENLTISYDGRFVAFGSGASNLVAGDTNGQKDIFVRDRQRGTTELVSVNDSGAQGNSFSSDYGRPPSISSDGRYVAFNSWATNLVPNDTNGSEDVFVHDRQTGTTQRVSVADSSGAQGNWWSDSPSMSSDGRFVAFASGASNLVVGDTNGRNDVFVHELDVTAPKVVSVVPARGATDVSRDINLEATFSEPVYYVKANFRLYREGSSTPVAALVTPVAATNSTKWVLNPDKALKPRTTYTAKVLTDVKDKVGSKLDQNPGVAGNQPMVWSFETGAGK
jgi:cold shock CspA family protein